MSQTLMTPLEKLDYWCSTQGDAIYLRQPKERQLHDITWTQAREMAYRLAGAMRQLGLQRGDKIALLSKNCAEWLIADLAIMVGGFVSVPIYPTANANTIEYTLQHSEAKAVFIGKLDNWKPQQAGILGHLLRFDMSYPTMPVQYPWHQLLSMADPLDEPKPVLADLMTIIYTSGSTGRPKGVMHTYANLAWACQNETQLLEATPGERLLSYLPLAHITERVIIQGLSLYGGLKVYFTESLETFPADLQIASPHYFLSVPRLWTIFQQEITHKIGEKKLEFMLKIPVIKQVVAKKIRTKLGLNNAKVLASGAAPIAPTLLQWYHNIGMNITEAWGMTENSAFAVLNFPYRADKIGTIGCAMPGCSVRISETSELEFKSPALLAGYYKDEAATADALTADGFLRTGDKATIDADGYLYFIGRLKDSFKTAKGKFVSPVPIERKLAQNNKIEMLCIIGSGQPAPIGLIQLSDTALQQNRGNVTESLQETLTQINAELESHEVLGGLFIVKEAWTIENDILTPTMKIKRHQLEQLFSARIKAVAKGQIVWED